MMNNVQATPSVLDAPDGCPPINGVRERILVATARLIVTNGLEFPMSRVARDSGLAVGSIYNNFPSKHLLIVGVYQRLADQIEPALTAMPPDVVDPKSRIIAYIHAYIDFFWADGDRAVLFEYLSNAPLIATTEVAELFRPLREYNYNLFAQAQANGTLKSMPPQSMAGFVGGGIRNALKWHRIGKQALSHTQRNDIAHMCWSAIAADTSDIAEM